MSEKVKEYTGEGIIVRYDVKRCIHFAACVRTLPNVFDPDKRPWIDPEQGNADEIAGAVMHCPTGALHFERTDQGAPEPLPAENVITVSADGPLYLRGDIEISGPDGTTLLKDTRVALCRCGASSNKPFCDGSHNSAGFQDTGMLAASQLKPGADGTVGGVLRVTPAANGPFLIKGNVELRSGDEQASVRGVGGALCRCGAASSKPFCDGSHKQAGFTAE
jgi:CDGSH-type Zn-finger protein/uncharacterized Fe-S cluster protein YjdI